MINPEYVKKKIPSEDCPVYLRSQGKKWSPYITPDQYPCSSCPFAKHSCDLEKLDTPKLREKIGRELYKKYSRWNTNVSWDEINEIVRTLFREDAAQILSLIPDEPKPDKLGDPIPKMTREEAGKIVLGAFGRRPDLPTGEEFVDEIRHGIEPDESRLLTVSVEDLTKRLDEISKAQQDLANSTEGHFEQGDMDALYIDGLLSLIQKQIKAQDAKTASIKDAEFANEKAEFGLSVHEAAVALYEAECQKRVEELKGKAIPAYGGNVLILASDWKDFKKED